MGKRSDWLVADQVLATDEQTQTAFRDAQLKLQIYETLDGLKPHQIPEYKPSRGEAVAIALLSDVHCEERVDPEDVPGVVNIYNPTVCRKRLEQFWQRLLVLVEAQRHLTRIDDLCLGLLGDIITGYLHDDQRESNFMSPTKAVLLAEELICGGLEFLLTHGNFQRIIIPCTPGNHGRTTIRPRAKTAMDNNFEWMMYQHLAQRWAKEKRLEWHIAGGAHVYLRLGSHMCRFHHGDDIHFQGGVGGLSIPLLKAIAQWNTVCHADYDFLGHWHQFRDFGHAIVNGSVVGYGAYALKAKCTFERPKQAFCLLDHKRGKSMSAEIWTDYLPPELEKQQ